MSKAHQVQPGGQAGRPGPDDRYLIAGRRRVVLKRCPNDGFVTHVWQISPVLISPVSHKTFDAHYIYRLIYFPAIACRLTIPVANPSTDGWEWMLAPDGPVRIRVSLLLDQGDIAHGTL